MTVQTSYSKYIEHGYPGMIFAQDPHDIFSLSAEGAIAFGVAVSRGTDKAKQAIKGGADFIGLSIRSLEREGAIYSGDIDYKDEDTVGIMRKGTLYAICPQGCNPGDPVDFAPATGILANGGAGTVIPTAFWDSVTVAGELATIRIDS